MPDPGAICPDPQRISEAANKRAPGSYLNKGSIVRVMASTIFNNYPSVSSAFLEKLSSSAKNHSLPLTFINIPLADIVVEKKSPKPLEVCLIHIKTPNDSDHLIIF